MPLVICGIGIIFSIVGMLLVRIKKDTDNPQRALNIGNFTAIILTAVAAFFVIRYMVPSTFTIGETVYPSMNIFWVILIGLAVGALMSIITEYFTAMGKKPVDFIVQQSATGAGTNVIAGLSMGMMSTALPILVLAAGIVVAFLLGGVYGVAIAATGMMATTGIQLAIDAFGPIADNAGGIAEMA